MSKRYDEFKLFEKKLWETHQSLRGKKQKEWKRTLPFNELFTNRWEKAKFIGAKKGTSIYDNSYVFGKVKIGKNTWVGPYTILDGSGGQLVIGDNCSISSGVHIYTHETVKWALSGGKQSYEKESVSIGNNCYIGPFALIGMGSKIGRCSIIGSYSLVNSSIPPYSIAFGIPARVTGKVKFKGKKISFEYFNKK